MSQNSNPNVLFLINNDLDFIGQNYIPFNFVGTLNGNGHKIKNIKISNYEVDSNDVETFTNIY